MTLPCPLCNSDKPPELGPHGEHYCSECRSLIGVTVQRLRTLGSETLVEAVEGTLKMHIEANGHVDSLDMAELWGELENLLGFTIPDSDYDKIRTPEAAIEFARQIRAIEE